MVLQKWWWNEFGLRFPTQQQRCPPLLWLCSTLANCRIITPPTWPFVDTVADCFFLPLPRVSPTSHPPLNKRLLQTRQKSNDEMPMMQEQQSGFNLGHQLCASNLNVNGMCHFLDASEGETQTGYNFFFTTTFHITRGHGCLPTNRKRSDLFTNYTVVADVFAIHKHCQPLMILIFIPGLSWEGNKQKTDKPIYLPVLQKKGRSRQVSQLAKFSCLWCWGKKVSSKFFCNKQTVCFAPTIVQSELSLRSRQSSNIHCN